MIFTSYFSKISVFSSDKFYKLSIANSVPNGVVLDGTLSALIPKWKIVEDYKAGLIRGIIYEERYLIQLRSLRVNWPKKLEELNNTSDKDIVLFCWESPEKFCHRHVLSNWVNESLGYELITEFQF